MEHDPQYLNYYERLGVSEDANPEEITAAYKALRKQFHPDTKPVAYRGYFDHMMKGINEAHDVLRDPVKRRRYDARLLSEHQPVYREQSPPRQHDSEKTRTRERSRKTKEHDAGQQYSFRGEIPTVSDYERLVDVYEHGVTGLKEWNTRAKKQLHSLTEKYMRLEEQYRVNLQKASSAKRRSVLRKQREENVMELSRIEQEMKSNFSEVHRRYDVEVFEELLAAIDYVEDYLIRLPKQRRRKLSSKHSELKKEAADLLNKRIVY